MNVTVTSPGAVTVGDAATAEQYQVRANGLQRYTMAAGRPPGCVETGLRAARERHPAMLRVLTEVANQVDKHADRAQGETRRHASTMPGRIEAHEVQIWRAAAHAAEQGAPNPAFGYLYGAVASKIGLAGLPLDYRD